jgi:phosphopantothenoylcysteine synthetase/decarboxylase
MLVLAIEQGWSVQVVATPAATKFFDVAAVEQRTGVPVRSDYRNSSGGRRNSSADVLVIAPATYNTINKLAVGVNDTYALNVAAESIGRGVPTVILPFVNSALAARRPFIWAVDVLRSEGVKVLFGPDVWTPHPPGAGDQHVATFPWSAALRAADAALREGPRLASES